MDSPLISIIVPVYKVENYISKCIDSILLQTYGNFELLLVNDGSPDSSREKCEAYAKRDNRIRVINKVNGGVSSARNLGIISSKGEYICFVDSDDSILPNYLKELYQDNLIAAQPCLVMHKYVVENLTLDFNNRVLINSKVSGDDFFKLIIKEKLTRFSAPYSKLFNAKIIRDNKIEFPLGVHMGEDAIFLMRYLDFVNNLITADKCNYLIFRREDSLMQTFNDFDSEFLGFNLWKESFCRLQKKYEHISDSLSKKILWENVEDPFIRCVQSVYKSKSNLTIAKQVSQLSQISKDDYDLLAKYYKPLELKGKVSKILLKYRAFYLYCLLGNIIVRFQK
ncbi:glycosyltransferase [Emticicia sp. CRIBPO]|uniref:glycosyltransferase family 2 protein n=1 Tax=Emticicia sp. CRIBPO TaxID=2683258 RepID=UPI001413143F|nr:glycosyltransferase family 2 protein [Emticicia sp. CRIBPO]NBA85282.1 glycosyltransferase [Emticicia sp. CRIBPO]